MFETLKRGILSWASVQLGLPFDVAATPEPAVHTGLVSSSPHPDTTRPVRPPRGVHALDALGPTYFVRLKRARRYLLRVDEDGRVRVTIPRGGSEREARRFALRNVPWVRRQRERLATGPASTKLSAVERAALRERARTELPPRLLALAAVHELTVTRITVRSQRTRWGSCSRDGQISLNWRLVLMPDWVRDYVLIHELMHLRRMDHSPAYWAFVAQACPGYREARAWLRAHGPALR